MKTLWWLALTACSSRHTLPTETITVDGTPVLVEVANDAAERARGLMHRDAIAKDEGMLFVYPDTAVRQFWMRNTRIPLSIAFIEESGRIARIADMRPFTERHTSSLYPVRYALEMNQGWFDAHDVKAGDLVTELTMTAE